MTTDEDDLIARVRAATELLEAIVADPSVLEHLTKAERIRLENAAGDVFEPDVEIRRRRVRDRKRREARVHHAERFSTRRLRPERRGR